MMINVKTKIALLIVSVFLTSATVGEHFITPCARCDAIAQAELTYFEGWPHGKVITSWTLNLSDSSPEALIMEPQYTSTNPLYGAYYLGNGLDTTIVFVIDESMGTGTGYDIVYVDSNNNEDLTDDGGPHTKVPWATGLALYPTVTVSYNVSSQETMGPYRMWAFYHVPPLETTLRYGYYTQCYYEGQITLNDTYNLFVWDSDNDAIYNDDPYSLTCLGHQLYIDFNKSGVYEGTYTERTIEGPYQLGDNFTWNDNSYYIKYISPVGNIVEIRPLEPSISDVENIIFNATAYSVYFVPTGNIYDDSAFYAFYSYKENPQVITSPTQSSASDAYIDVDGSPLFDGDIVTFGGRFANRLVAYYEDAGLAKIGFANNGTHRIFRRISDGTHVHAVDSSTYNESEKDYFVFQVYADGGRYILSEWGIRAPGTYAGGTCFIDIIYPNLQDYTDQFYIFSWTDTNNDDMPQPEEITLETSGS